MKSRKHNNEATSLGRPIPREADWQGQKGRQAGPPIQMPGKSQGLQTGWVSTFQGLAPLPLGSHATHLLCVSNKKESTNFGARHTLLLILCSLSLSLSSPLPVIRMSKDTTEKHVRTESQVLSRGKKLVEAGP